MAIAFLCDWITTYEINVGPLYLIVVVYAAWHFRWSGAIMASIAVALLWVITDLGTGHRYSQAWIVWQQFGTRLFVYIGISLSVSIYRRTLEAHRRRLAVLERVLIVCPSCGRIGPREGGWMHAEEFVRKSGEIYKFCPDCRPVAPAHASSHPARPELN